MSGEISVSSVDDRVNTKRKIVDWIQHILRRKDWNGTELAKKADLAPSTILRLMNDKNHDFVSTFKTMKKISSASGFPIPNEILESYELKTVHVRPEDPLLSPSGRRETEALVSARAVTRARTSALNVKHISSLPEGLQPMPRDNMVVECPGAMEGDPTAFAVYMNDNELAPFLPHGTLLYATKHRDPQDGDVIIITTKSRRSFVRVMLRINEDGVHLAAGKHSKETLIPFDDIDEIAVVVGHMRS